MTYLRWALTALLIAGLAALLHYSLPSREVVRIVGHEVKRLDTEIRTEGGEQVVTTRDVRFVYAITPEGRERAYRNEDTDFGWPPYFKFDTADIAARVANSVSTEADPRWVVVTHYGWRSNFISWFENIVGIRDATGPDEELIPWFNGAVIAGLAILILLVRQLLRAAYARHVDPLVDAADEQIDEIRDRVSDHYTGVSGWFRRLLGR